MVGAALPSPTPDAPNPRHLPPQRPPPLTKTGTWGYMIATEKRRTLTVGAALPYAPASLIACYIGMSSLCSVGEVVQV